MADAGAGGHGGSAVADDRQGSHDSSHVVLAFQRGLRVIECFTAQRPAMTIAEVARLTGMDRATARRLLHTLEADGYAGCRDGLWFLKPDLLELGYTYLSGASIDGQFQRRLQELAERLREPCAAAVLDGPDIVFVSRARASTPRVIGLALEVGKRLPAHLTAMGRVLLAQLGPDDLDAFLASARLNDRRRVGHDEAGGLRRDLAVIRESGWCLRDHEIEVGVRVLAVPLLGYARVPLAVGVASHVPRTSSEAMLEENLPVLKSAVAELTEFGRPPTL